MMKSMEPFDGVDLAALVHAIRIRGMPLVLEGAP